MSPRPRGVRRLGELVLRTGSLDAMTTFYRDVIGLEPYAFFDRTRFFKVADDLEGHPEILAVFSREHPSNGPGEPPFPGLEPGLGPLHHFAFSVDPETFATERERLEGLGCEIRATTHPRMAWRSFYLHDPDGNTVEFVAHDPGLG